MDLDRRDISTKSVMIDANLDGRFAPKSKAMSANDILELPISCMAKTRALLNHCELVVAK